MVRILEISSVRSMGCLHMEDGSTFWLKQTEIEEAGFRPGQSLDDKVFIRQIRLFQYPRALNHAVSMLSRRPCSKGEIQGRLRARKYTEDVIELVLYKLEKENLLNDEEFCRLWIQYGTERNKGPYAIRRELMMKQIPSDMIDQAMSEIAEEDTISRANELAQKLWEKSHNDSDLRRHRQHVIQALVRKGYNWNTAVKACESAEKEK